MHDRADQRVAPGWSARRLRYSCMDGVFVGIRHNTAQYRLASGFRPGRNAHPGFGQTLVLRVPRYGVVYQRLPRFKRPVTLAATNALFDRAEETL